MGNAIALSEEGSKVQDEADQERIEESDTVRDSDEEDKTVGDGDEENGTAGDGEEEDNAVAVRETEEESDQGEEEEKPKITVDDIKTAPWDWRFPTTNQAKHCYTRYNEFHKCAAEKGEDAKECQKYAKYYRSLCPGEWIDKWNEEREAGTWPGRY